LLILKLINIKIKKFLLFLLQNYILYSNFHQIVHFINHIDLSFKFIKFIIKLDNEQA